MSTHAARRSRLTLVLAGVLALLIGIIAWMEFGQQVKPLQNSRSIDHILINRSGHATIELKREQNNWRITKPYSMKANAQRIEPLLGLGVAELDGYSTSEVDMNAVGLESPGASISFGERKFQLGNADATGDRRYTLVDGIVSFVPEWVWSLLHGGTTAFAELTVFESLPEAVYLHLNNDNSEANPGNMKPANVEQWQALQADKILPWPLENPQVLGDQLPIATHTLHASSVVADSDKLAELFEYQDVTLINTQPGYAFAISNERMHKLLYP